MCREQDSEINHMPKSSTTKLMLGEPLRGGGGGGQDSEINQYDNFVDNKINVHSLT